MSTFRPSIGETPANPALWEEAEVDGLIDSILVDPYQYSSWTDFGGDHGKEERCARLSRFLRFFGIAPRPADVFRKLTSAVRRGLASIDVPTPIVDHDCWLIGSVSNSGNFVGATMLAVKAMCEVRDERINSLEYSREAHGAFGHSRVQGERPVPTHLPNPGEGIGERGRPLVNQVRDPRGARPKRKRATADVVLVRCTPPPEEAAATKAAKTEEVVTNSDFEEEDLEAAEDEALADYEEWKREKAQSKLRGTKGDPIVIE